MTQVLSPELSERMRRLSDEAMVLVLEAFREGQRAGAARLGAFCQTLLDELEQHYDALTPELIAHIEATYETAGPSPVIAASFGGAGDVLERVRGEIRRVEATEPTTPLKASQ